LRRLSILLLALSVIVLGVPTNLAGADDRVPEDGSPPVPPSMWSEWHIGGAGLQFVRNLAMVEYDMPTASLPDGVTSAKLLRPLLATPGQGDEGAYTRFVEGQALAVVLVIDGVTAVKSTNSYFYLPLTESAVTELGPIASAPGVALMADCRGLGHALLCTSEAGPIVTFGAQGLSSLTQTLSRAANVDTEVGSVTTLEAYPIAPGQTVWLRTTTYWPGVLETTVSWSPTTTNLDMAIYRGVEEAPLACVGYSASLTDMPEVVSYLALEPGYYWCAVWSVSGEATFDCTGMLYGQQDVGAQILAGQEHWASVSLDETGTIDLKLWWDNTGADLAMTLYDTDFGFLAMSWGSGQVERIRYDAASAGTYPIKIVASHDALYKLSRISGVASTWRSPADQSIILCPGPDSAYIKWAGSYNDNPRIDYGVTPDLGSTLSGEASGAITAESRRPKWLLIPGLEPDQTYYFRVSSSGALWPEESDIYLFTTQDDYFREWMRELSDPEEGYPLLSNAYFNDLWFPLRRNDGGTKPSTFTDLRAPYGEPRSSAYMPTMTRNHRGADFESTDKFGEPRKLFPVWGEGHVYVKQTTEDPSYGLYVTIQHVYVQDGTDYQFQSFYAHFSKLNPDYEQDTMHLPHTQELGISGSTGFSTGVHLHLEFRRPTPPSTLHQPAYPMGYFYRQSPDAPAMQTITRLQGNTSTEVRVRVTTIRSEIQYEVPAEWVQLYYSFDGGPWRSARMNKEGFEHYRDLTDLGIGAQAAEVFVVAFSDGWSEGVYRPVVAPYSHSDGTPDLAKTWPVPSTWPRALDSVASGTTRPASATPGRPLTGRTLTVLEQYAVGVWQVQANDTGAVYCVSLPGEACLQPGDAIQIVGALADLQFPGGPLVKATWWRSLRPDTE